MNITNLVSSVINRVLRRLLNRGVDAGFDMVARKNKPGAAGGPDQTPAARAAAQKMRDAAKVTKRF